MNQLLARSLNTKVQLVLYPKRTFPRQVELRLLPTAQCFPSKLVNIASDIEKATENIKNIPAVNEITKKKQRNIATPHLNQQTITTVLTLLTMFFY